VNVCLCGFVPMFMDVYYMLPSSFKFLGGSQAHFFNDSMLQCVLDDSLFSEFMVEDMRHKIFDVRR